MWKCEFSVFLFSEQGANRRFACRPNSVMFLLILLSFSFLCHNFSEVITMEPPVFHVKHWSDSAVDLNRVKTTKKLR